MSTTDTRSGFRLPWSSDRSREDVSQAQTVGTAPEIPQPDVADSTPLSDGSDVGPDESWPSVDVAARLRDSSIAGGPPTSPYRAQEPNSMANPFAAPTIATAAAPRKPSKLMTDLVAAMRATAEVAREQALSQVEADARQLVEQIRNGATDGTAELRRRSDEDIAGIREWSKAEVARIREQTDLRIAERKAMLEAEIAAHAADIDRHVEQVSAAVAAYEADMAAFFERLLGEDDPARLATMAEQMPEPPALDTISGEPDPFAEYAIADSGDRAMTSEDTETEAEAWAAEAAATVEAEAATEVVDDEAEAEVVEVETEAEVAEAEHSATTEARTPGSPWGDSDTLTGAFGASPRGSEDGSPASDAPDAAASGPTGDPDLPRWAAGPGEDGSADTGAGAGSPVDRGSIMAALEAAAEAVVAAEAAAESADQAEAAADVAETAAELIVGRVDTDEEADHEAEAALAARMDAGGLEREPSLADRLASLLPGAGSGDDATPITTQVVVTGLVSVASIASFKRHLGRVHGVQSVTVASGPDGEFVFHVTHRGDAGMRDAIPSLPGFAARVTGTGDGVLTVAARDPETEG